MGEKQYHIDLAPGDVGRYVRDLQGLDHAHGDSQGRHDDARVFVCAAVRVPQLSGHRSGQAARRNGSSQVAVGAQLGRLGFLDLLLDSVSRRALRVREVDTFRKANASPAANPHFSPPSRRKP